MCKGVVLKFEEETKRIIGCAMEVSNTIGHGLYEKVYENALVVEFGLSDISVEQQKSFPVIYKTVEVGKFIPDLICFDKIIVDAKTIQSISDREIGQMLSYLKITDLEVGLIINFKHARLEWKRVTR